MREKKKKQSLDISIPDINPSMYLDDSNTTREFCYPLIKLFLFIFLFSSLRNKINCIDIGSQIIADVSQEVIYTKNQTSIRFRICATLL